jgi:hypothetical protein
MKHSSSEGEREKRKKMKKIITILLISLLFIGCTPDGNTDKPLNYYEIAGRTLDINIDNGSNIYIEKITFDYNGKAIIVDGDNNYYLSNWYFNDNQDVVVENEYYIKPNGDLIEIQNPQTQTFEFQYTDDLYINVIYQMYTKNSYYDINLESLNEMTYEEEYIIEKSTEKIPYMDRTVYTTDEYFDFFEAHH